MKGKLGSVEKSTSLKIVSDGMIESLLTSDKLEDIKLAAEVLKNRELHRVIDEKYQANKYLENKRQAKYYKAGYGNIIDKDNGRYQHNISTQNALNKFMDEPTWAQKEEAIIAHRVGMIQGLLWQSLSAVTVIGMLIVFI